jgi:hypothetical protein
VDADQEVENNKRQAAETKKYKKIMSVVDQAKPRSVVDEAKPISRNVV